MSEELRDREAELGEIFAEIQATVAAAKQLRGRDRVQVSFRCRWIFY